MNVVICYDTDILIFSPVIIFYLAGCTTFLHLPAPIWQFSPVIPIKFLEQVTTEMSFIYKIITQFSGHTPEKLPEVFHPYQPVYESKQALPKPL